MKFLTKRLGGGFACAAIAIAFLSAVVLTGLPATRAAFFASAPWLAGAVLTVVVAVFAAKAFAKRYPDAFEKIEGKLVLLIFIILAGAVVVLSTLLAAMIAWKILSATIAVWNGNPVDKIGTIVPIGKWTISGLYTAGLLIVACVVRHCILPMAATMDTVWEKGVYCVGFTSVSVVVVAVAIALPIYECSVDRTAQTRANLTSNIAILQDKLRELDAKPGAPGQK